MELSCCIKGGQRLLTTVPKDFLVMNTAVIHIPAECLLHMGTLHLEMGARMIAFPELGVPDCWQPGKSN